MSNRFGETLQGTLLDSATVTYELVADDSGEVRFKFNHPNGVGTAGQPIELKLYDAASNVVAMLTAYGNDEMLATVASAGTYYLKVRDADVRGNTAAPYTVQTRLTHEPNTTYDGGANNTAPTALPAPLGDPIRGRLEDGDIDFFKVHTDTGGALTLRFLHPHGIGASGELIEVKVTDTAGRTVTSEQLHGDATLVTTVAGAGDYYISVRDVISSRTNDPGLYTLTPSLNYYRDVVYDGPANDSAATALALPLGRTAIGRLEDGDSDWFKFEASASGTLAVNFLHPNGAGNTGSYIGITILDGSGKQIVAQNERGSDLFTANLTTGGTYYVKVADSINTANDGLYKLMAGVAGNGGKTIVVNDPAPFSGTAGNDVVQGANGRDTMKYSGKAADYDINISPAGASVLDRHGAEGSDTLFNVERLQFDDKAVAIDTEGDGGRLFRLYQAALGRTPDESGFGYWLYHLDRGVQLHTVAAGFVDSTEFHDLFGPDGNDADFVRALYQNVLHRGPDQAGLDYWVHILEQHQADRPDVLIEFANSAENVTQVIGSTMHGMAYHPWAA